MAQLASEAASNLLFRSQVFGLLGRSPGIAGIDRWIRGCFVYREELEEVLRTPQFMMDHLQVNGFIDGDCDDVSTFLAAVCKALGYSVCFKAIRYRAEIPEFEHVYIEADSVVLDPTVVDGTDYNAVETMTVNV